MQTWNHRYTNNWYQFDRIIWKIQESNIQLVLMKFQAERDFFLLARASLFRFRHLWIVFASVLIEYNAQRIDRLLFRMFRAHNWILCTMPYLHFTLLWTDPTHCCKLRYKTPFLRCCSFQWDFFSYVNLPCTSGGCNKLGLCFPSPTLRATLALWGYV